jgi:hypothetical protein
LLSCSFAFSVSHLTFSLALSAHTQANVDSLVPGAVVLYKTNESENGLKLATVVSSTTGTRLADADRRKYQAILHFGATHDDLKKRRVPVMAVYREVGIVTRHTAQKPGPFPKISRGKIDANVPKPCHLNPVHFGCSSRAL